MRISALGRAGIAAFPILAGVLASLTWTTDVAVAKEPGIAIEWDPRYSDKVSAVWLGYLTARALYRPEHHIPMPPSGEIVATFDEEVYARDTAATIYLELREKDKKLNDGYWNDLLKVQARKFMPEYVWTYLRKPSWAENAKPAHLDAFRKWSSQNLPNHKPQTRGGLAVSNS